MTTTNPDLVTTAVLPAFDAPRCAADATPSSYEAPSDIEVARQVRDCRRDPACAVTAVELPAVDMRRALKVVAGTHPVVTEADLLQVVG